MASVKRIQCCLLVLVLLSCAVGCMALRPAFFFDSLGQEDAIGKGAAIQGVLGVAESQPVLTEEADLGEEERILLDSKMVSNTMDYTPPGSNHDHDGGHHP